MKILILGVGNAQVDAIEYCKAQGHEVYGCSYTNHEKGIALLDHFSQRNITDVDSIMEYVRAEGIDVVYSVGSDIAMPTACKVSEALGMPHLVSAETAMVCNHKQRLRELLGEGFRGNVNYIYAANKDELAAFTDFPGIIKPVDSQGQRGVFRVDSLEEAQACFDQSVSYSRDGKVILERFLDGEEVSVNAYFLDGEMAFGLVSDRISYSEFPGGIIKEHYLPCHFPQDVQDRILDLARRVAEKVGVTNGPCYYQIKVVDGEPYLLEVTPRLDGCHMWKLIRYYTGIDLLDLTFRQLLGEAIGREAFAVEPVRPRVRTVFMCQPPQTAVVRASYPDALCEVWYYEEGETVRRMNGYMEKCGYRMETY